MNWAIFKPYAKAILAMISIVTVLAVLALVPVNGKTGLEHIIGAGADFNDMDYSSFQDVSAMKQYAESGLPEIRFLTAQVFANKNTNLDAMFTAEGTDGQKAEITIEDVTTAAGESILFASENDKRKDVRMQNTDAFRFAVCGIYSVYVKAEDGNQRVSYMKCNIPVAHE